MRKQKSASSKDKIAPPALALARARIAALTEEASRAVEAERERFAMELHDEFGQRLTLLKLILHRMAPALEGSEPQPAWHAAQAELDALIAHVRRMSGSLYPPSLRHLGLRAALEDLLERQFGNTGISCQLEAGPVPEGLDEKLALTAYRLVQESVANTMRYADAARVEVSLVFDQQARRLDLAIHDDGVGLPALAGEPSGIGSGLNGMRTRVENLGGSFMAGTSKWGGTTVMATIPVP